MGKQKPLRWLNPRSDGKHSRDNREATDSTPVASSNRDQCCMCRSEGTCSTGGDRYCGTHCPNQGHH